MASSLFKQSLYLLSTSTLLVFLASCAAKSPRGQIVSLNQGIPSMAPESIELARKDSLMHQQSETAVLSVPAKKDDAAIYYFSLGQAYSLDNDVHRAIEAYRATLVYDPKSALVRTRLAAELVKIGSYAEARTLCEEAVNLDPKYIESLLLLAGIQVSSKEYQNGISSYKKVLSIEPVNRDALLYLGVTLAEAGRAKEGIGYLKKLVALKDSPESNLDRSVAFYYLAKVYQQDHEMGEAIAALKESLKHRSGFSRAAILLADIYNTKRDSERAIAVLKEAFEESHSADLAERLSEIYLEKNDFKAAVVYLETLVEEDPSNENLKLRLALLYWQNRWLDKANALLAELHLKFPLSNEIAFFLGELNIERKDLATALKVYQGIDSEYTKYEQVVSRILAINKANNTPAEQMRLTLQTAMEKRSDIVSFYPMMATLWEDDGKLDDAKKILELGAERFDREEGILYYLGFVYDRLGNKVKAFATIEKILEKNPDHANALNFLGYSLLESNGELKLASKYLERAYTLKPDDPYILDSYGVLLQRTGKASFAMKILEKALALKPEESVIVEHLADVYVALNLSEKALAAYERAKEIGGNEEFQERLAKKIENMETMLADSRRSQLPRDLAAKAPVSSRSPASVDSAKPAETSKP